MMIIFIFVTCRSKKILEENYEIPRYTKNKLILKLVMITIVHGWIIMDFTRERGNIWSSAPSLNLTGGPWTHVFQNIVHCGRCCQNKTFFSCSHEKYFLFCKITRNRICSYFYNGMCIEWCIEFWIILFLLPIYMHLWKAGEIPSRKRKRQTRPLLLVHTCMNAYMHLFTHYHLRDHSYNLYKRYRSNK